jgi:hypothetical protein
VGVSFSTPAQVIENATLYPLPKKWAREKFPSVRPRYGGFSALPTVLPTETVHKRDSDFAPTVLASTVEISH